MDKPLARLIFVRRLDVDKDQVLRSGLFVEAWTSHAIDWRSYSNSIFEINLTLL